jgi:hypothetical protein
MQKKIIASLMLLVCFNLFSQEIETEVYEPFMTAYDNLFGECTSNYDDLIVYQPGWGIVLFGKDESGEIVELSRLYCDILYTCVRKADYLYYCTTTDYEYMSNENNRVIKIDISDPANPWICDELELDVSVDITTSHILGNYLFVVAYNAYTYFKIDLDEFFQTESFFINTHGSVLKTVGDYLLTYNSDDQFILYQDGEEGLEVVADNFDLFEAHQGDGIRNVWQLSDDVFCTVGAYNLVIWEVSDLTNWIDLQFWGSANGEFINNNGDLAFYENKIYISSTNKMYCLELDEDYIITEENSINYGYPVSPDGIGNIDELLILPTDQGIMEFEITTDDFEWNGYLDGDSGYGSHHLIGDKYFAMSGAPDNYQGLKMYDMTDPANPQYVTTHLNDHNYWFFDSAGDYFIMRDFSEYLWDIFKYENDEMQLLLSNTASGVIGVKYYPCIDESDPNSLYAFNNSTHMMRKYHVIEQNVELTYEATYPDQKLGFIKNGLGYFMSDNNGSYDLLIYDGFDIDDPVLVNQFPGVITASYAGLKYVNEDYLSVINPLEQTILYSYQESELTGQSFQLSPSYVNSGMFIDNYLVGFGNNKLFFYDISESTTGYVQPVMYIPLCHQIYRVILYETATGNYLICFSQFASSIVSVDVSNDVPECEILKTENSINNYPNPFNPSTTISFLTTEGTENTEISIFNIRGQKIRTLVDEILPAGKHSINWDGKDNQGAACASGIYFSQLRAGKEVIRDRMLLVK